MRRYTLEETETLNGCCSPRTSNAVQSMKESAGAC